MGERPVHTDFRVCWETSLKTRHLAGAISHPASQHESHLQEAGLRRLLLPRPLAVHQAPESSWGFTHSKAISLGTKLRANSVRAVHGPHPASQVYSCHLAPCPIMGPQPSPHASPSCVPPATKTHWAELHPATTPCCTQPHTTSRTGVKPPDPAALWKIWHRTIGPAQILLTLIPHSKFPSGHNPPALLAWVALTPQRASRAHRRQSISVADCTERKRDSDTTAEWKPHA